MKTNITQETPFLTHTQPSLKSQAASKFLEAMFALFLSGAIWLHDPTSQYFTLGQHVELLVCANL